MQASASSNTLAVTQTASVPNSASVRAEPSAANGFADALQQAAAKPPETQENTAAADNSAPASPPADTASGSSEAAPSSESPASPPDGAQAPEHRASETATAANFDALDGSALPPWLPAAATMSAPAMTPPAITAMDEATRPATEVVHADPAMPALLLQAMRQNVSASKQATEISAASTVPTADTPAIASADLPELPAGTSKPMLATTSNGSATFDQVLAMSSAAAATSAPVDADLGTMMTAQSELPIDINTGLPSTAMPATGGAASAARTGEPANASVPVPMTNPQWNEAFASRIAWHVREGVQHVSLALNPAELGPVEVRLSVSDGQVSAQFHSAHHGVRQAIEEAMPKLREMLSQSGLNLADANVSQQTPGRDDRAGQPGSRWSAGDDSLNDIDATAATAATPLRQLGLIDAYV